jgi:hypothetical protein
MITPNYSEKVMDTYALGTEGRFKLIWNDAVPESKRWSVRTPDGTYSFHNAKRKKTLNSLGEWFFRRLIEKIAEHTGGAITEDEIDVLRGLEYSLDILIGSRVSFAESLDTGFKEFNTALLRSPNNPLVISSYDMLKRYREGDPFPLTPQEMKV